MWEFVDERKAQIAFSAYQHVSLVVQAVLLATIVAVVIAVIVTRVPRLEPVANALSAIGLTIPSFALLGILIPLVGIGVTPAFIAVAFYAALPVLRNAVVGLQGVDRALVESARGLGMGEVGTLTRVRLPWPGRSSSPGCGSPPRCPWGSPPSPPTSSAPAWARSSSRACPRSVAPTP